MSRASLQRWALASFLICLAIVLYAVFRPEPPPQFFVASDKIGHVIGFFALSLTARLAFPRVPVWLFWPLFLVVAPIMEWLQHALQPSRVYGLDDGMANVGGVLAAGACWGLFWLYTEWKGKGESRGEGRESAVDGSRT